MAHADYGLKILSVHVHLITTFPVCRTLTLNLPISCSPETLFCSLQTINLQSFARLRMGNCLAVIIWGGDRVVCLRNNLYPVLYIWDPPHFTSVPRDRCFCNLQGFCRCSTQTRVFAFVTTGPFPLFSSLSNRLPPVLFPASPFYCCSFFSLRTYAFKNLSDLFLVSEVTEIRWVVQMAFLTTSLPMIYFSNFLSPRPGERQEGAWRGLEESSSPEISFFRG